MTFAPAIEESLASLPEPERAKVREALPRPEDLPENAPYERVLAAILSLGAQGADRIAHFADAARKD